jgi:D-arabinose 1-dehydrogenase-like Zn-dependent alcohol dehydrogenase
VPEAVDFCAAGLVSCAVITAVHAFRRSGLILGDTAVVVGAGGIGLILIQILTGAGLSVVAVSRSEASRSLAARHGAGLALSLDDPDLGAQVRRFSRGGAACAFDLVGLAVTVKAAAECVGRGGRIVVIGEEAECPPVDTVTIAQRELEIIGSRNGGMQDAVDAVGLLAAGTVRPWIDRRLPLAEINEGFARVRGGQAHGRVVVVVKEEGLCPGSTR